MIVDLLIKASLAGALGALIGIEREYAKKQHLFGARTFLLIALLGTLSAELPAIDTILAYFPLVSFACVLLISYYFYKISSETHKAGLTTLVLFPLVFIIGILISYHFYVEAVALAVVITAILYAKKYSVKFTQKLTDAEWSDIIRFGIIIFVLYPIFPSFYTLYGITFNIDLFFKMIYYVSAISFIAFILHRAYPKLPLYIMGFLGGLINSTSVIYVLSEEANKIKRSLFKAYSSAVVASSLRNLVFILLISLPVFMDVWPYFIAVIVIHAAAQFISSARTVKLKIVKMNHPFTIGKAVELALVFLVVSALLDTVVASYSIGYYVVAFIGGIFSTIATIASILSMSSSGMYSPNTTSIAIICSLLGTIVANSLVSLTCRNDAMKRAMLLSLLISALCVGALAIYQFIV